MMKKMLAFVMALCLTASNGIMPVYSVTVPEQIETLTVNEAQSWTPNENGFYEINTAEDLLAFAALVNNGNTSINGKLMADIDLAGKDWTPIGGSSMQYSGIFDGQGHTVSNIKRIENRSYLGLVGYANGSTVKNVVVENAQFSGYQYAGGIVGRLASGTIENCAVIGDSILVVSNTSDSYIGGIVGKVDQGTVQNCFNAATVTGGGQYVGGVVGYVSSGITLTGCFNIGAVTGKQYTAGIVGRLPFTGTTITNNLTMGIVLGETSYVGAVYGTGSGTVSHNYYLIGSAKIGDTVMNGVGKYNATPQTDTAGKTDGKDAAWFATSEAVTALNNGGDAWIAGADYPVLKVFGNVPTGGEPEPGCDHSWQDATCTKPKTCLECGETEGNALGHTEQTIPGKDTTCTEPGLTEGKKCSVCGAILAEQTEIACPGHTEQTIPGKDATCTETGLTEGKYCTVCGTVTAQQTATPVLGHSYENGQCIRCEDVVQAKILDVYYKTLKEAIENAKDGDTIVLLRDLSLNEADSVELDGTYKTMFKVEGKRITVDLNGKVISADATLMGVGCPVTKTENGFGTMIDWTGALLDGMLVGVFATDNNGHLTLEDSSADKTGAVIAQAYDEAAGKCGIVYALLVNYEAGCSITVNGGNYVLDIARDCLIYSGCSHNENEGVEVNGGTFRLGNVGQGRNQSPWIFNVKGRNEGHAHINGGSFNADIRNQYWIFEAQASGDCALVYSEETGMYTIVAANYMVNQQYKTNKWYTYEKGYVTLEEAMVAAGENAANAAAAGQMLCITGLGDKAGEEVVIDPDTLLSGN